MEQKLRKEEGEYNKNYLKYREKILQRAKEYQRKKTLERQEEKKRQIALEYLKQMADKK